MELRFTATAKDYIALFDRYAAGSAVAQRFVRMAFVMIPALAWLSAILFYVKQHTFNNHYIFYGIFALFLSVSLPTLYKAYQNAFWGSILTPQSLRGLVGSTLVQVNETHIRKETPHLTFHAAWSDVEAVEQTREGIFVFIAPLVAILIPRHTFASESEYRSLNEKIQAYHAAGRTIETTKNGVSQT